MAAALIWYQQRKQQAAAKRREGREKAAKPAAADPSGTGVVIFDVETTQLVEEEVRVEDMEVSVACARWVVPAGGRVRDAQSTDGTFWHEDVGRTPEGGTPSRVEELLKWFDQAKMIVAYNGREFDMKVLRSAYGGDEERWDAHMAKMQDPMEPVLRQHGRRLKLSTLLRENGKGEKAGAGCDAPRWWHEGKWEQLARYCKRDVDALTELVVQPSIRLPGRGSTAEASVYTLLRNETIEKAAREKAAEEAAAAAEDLEEDGDAPAPDEEEAAAVRDAQEARGEGTAEEDGMEESGRRGKRRCSGREGAEVNATAAAAGTSRKHAEGPEEAVNGQVSPKENLGTPVAGRKRPQRDTPTPRYDETRRRNKRRRKYGAFRPYMDRSSAGYTRAGAKRLAIEMGAAVLTRAAAGEYEWRDAGMGPVKRPKHRGTRITRSDAGDKDEDAQGRAAAPSGDAGPEDGGPE